MAVVETIVAPFLYLWLAFHLGWLVPLYAAVLVAPFVLLRSEQSIALGVRFALSFEQDLSATRTVRVQWQSVAILVCLLAVFWFSVFQFTTFEIPDTSVPRGLMFVWLNIALMLGLFAITMFVVAVVIRISATLTFWREGLKNIPENFRILLLCISPSQLPEFVPGLSTTNSRFTIVRLYKFLATLGHNYAAIHHLNDAIDRWWLTRRQGSSNARSRKYPQLAAYLTSHFFAVFLYLPVVLLVFVPAWIYRLSIKSTIWFWWPLVFIGDELKTAKNPTLLQWTLTGSLWAKGNVLIALFTLASFIAVNGLLNESTFDKNPLLVPIGYLLLFDWSLRPWQFCAIAASFISIILVFWMNNLAGKLLIAENTDDRDLKMQNQVELGWVERLVRLRSLFSLLFWILVSVHALSYLNAERCFVRVPSAVLAAADLVYGDQMPKNKCYVERP